MGCTDLLVKLFLYVCFLFLYMSDLMIVCVGGLRSSLSISVYMYVCVCLIRSN